MIFATPETIIQPKGGDYKPDELDDRDLVLGASIPKKFGAVNYGQVLVEDGDWTLFDTLWESQKNQFGWDSFWCVIFSLNKVHQFIIKRKYGITVNFSDRFGAIISNTTPGVGNGIKSVAETKRKLGFLWENECPFLPTMSEKEAYAPLTQKEKDRAKERLKEYGFGYMWAAGTTNQNLLPALRCSPLQAVVETPYVFNSKDEIINAGNDYSHAITIAKIDQSEGFRAVRDSETQQWLKFAPDYSFVSVMAHFVEKKTMKLYKKNGLAAIYIKHWSQDSLFAFADGIIPGGDIFKTLYGITEYSQLSWENVDELPFPVIGFVTTTPSSGALILI